MGTEIARVRAGIRRGGLISQGNPEKKGSFWNGEQGVSNCAFALGRLSKNTDKGSWV